MDPMGYIGVLTIFLDHPNLEVPKFRNPHQVGESSGQLHTSGRGALGFQ